MDEQHAMEPTTQSWEGPKTIEEAQCFHQGFLSGATTYAREKGDSTLKAENELLRKLLDDQGWKTVEMLERMPRPDWRVGLSVKPKYANHELKYEVGKVLAVNESGFGNLHDENGILTIEMQSGRVLLARSDEWVTA